MSRTNLRVLGSSISRLLGAQASTPPVVAKLVAVPLKHQLTRDLHNKTANQQTTVASSSVATPHVAPLASEGLHKLDDLKVFQDEQIVQLAFKSGLTVNYSMSWLRNLCSCPSCLSDKLLNSPSHQAKSIKSSSLVDDQTLSVSRFSSTEEELVIEWLTTDYKSHTSKYNLKFLSLYANGRS